MVIDVFMDDFFLGATVRVEMYRCPFCIGFRCSRIQYAKRGKVEKVRQLAVSRHGFGIDLSYCLVENIFGLEILRYS